MRVFPLKFGTKNQPLTAHGCHDATTDEKQIREWWNRWPKANIGIATGNRLAVIDIDVDEAKGKNGMDALKEWEAIHSELPSPTWRALTPRGGVHLYYWTDYPITNKVNHLEAVDIRGNGGYVVAPPSAREDGRYEWEEGPEDNIEILEADATVNEFLKSGKTEPPREPPRQQSPILEGQRTDYLFKLTSSLQGKGMSDEAIRVAIAEENQKRCVPPMTDKELEQTVFPVLKRYEKGTTSLKPASSIIRVPGIVTMNYVEEQTAEWLIPGYIPRYQITALVGDGGVGKTTVWCSLAAAVSSGRRSLFEDDLPEGWGTRQPESVLFLSSEDSIEYTLRKRLRIHGANLENIYSISIQDEAFNDLKFGGELLESIIAQYQPGLVLFDPLQSFVPPDIQMGQRNSMRSCLNPLIGIGERYKTTFIIVVHTNKRSGAYGRNRMADSSDVWDIARSILMMGTTKDKDIRYISHEKSNYGPMQDTVLFSIDDGKAVFRGYSDKKDRDYVEEYYETTRQRPAMEEAKEFILNQLRDGEMEAAELDSLAKAMGIAAMTFKRARGELSREGKIIHSSLGFGESKKHFWKLTSKPSSDMTEMIQ